MEQSISQQFCFNYKDIATDEIALEGLEGLGIDFLWNRIEYRTSITLTERLKSRIWTFVLQCKEIKCYKTPEPHNNVLLRDRFEIVEKDSGKLQESEENLDGPYEYCPVKDDFGSCKHYKTRVEIPKNELESLSHSEVLSKYGRYFVLVASLKERWKALAPHLPISKLQSLNKVLYCFLELVGRSRENGQMSTGSSNILKITKEAKIMFYNKKQLENLDLVKCFTIKMMLGKMSKSIIIRLKRFYKPKLATIPKVGPVYELIKYLKNQPSQSAMSLDLMNQNLLKSSMMKGLKKTTNIFHIEEKQLEEPPTKKMKKEKIRKLYTVQLVPESDESSSSESDETESVKVKTSFNIGINIHRQAYQLFLKSGVLGLTQNELGHSLGLDYYTSRNICRVFKAKNIIRQVLEDRGRQRITRYIAIAANYAGDADYKKEREKFLASLEVQNVNTDTEHNVQPTPSTSQDEEVPSKKQRTESETDIAIDEIELDEEDTIVPLSESLKTKKVLSLRQLKFANGVLKVLAEKKGVCGFQTLSSLVAQSINVLPMATKSLKRFLFRLCADDLIKIYRLKWPQNTHEKFTNFICLGHVKKNDELVRNKYRELCLRSITASKPKHKQVKIETKTKLKTEKPLVLYSLPRYSKLKAFHKFLTNLILFAEKPPFINMPPGMGSLVHIIPEMTVELALGHISPIAMDNLKSSKTISITDKILGMKLCEAPKAVYTMLLQSRSLNNCLRESLSVLASFGLIQLCNRTYFRGFDKHSGLLGYLFYINRNAKLINTTGTWPRPNVDVTDLEVRFRFDNENDVNDYWKKVYDISINTNIVNRIKKKRALPRFPLRKQDELIANDTGEIFGDGCGPSGLDSVYYLDIQRHWETLNYMKMMKHSEISSKIRKLRPKPPRKCRGKILKKNLKETFGMKNESNEKQQGPKRRKRRNTSSKPAWSFEEDRVLMLCKTAMTVISPQSLPGSMTIKNLAAKDILTIRDPNKTSDLYHRRAMVIDSNFVFKHESRLLIHELKRRPKLFSKYDGVLKKIKAANTLNTSKYVACGRIATLELVYFFMQVIKMESFNKTVPCAALSYEEFIDKYDITKPNEVTYSCVLPDAAAIEIETIKEGIIVALNNKHNREDYRNNQELYTFLDQCDHSLFLTAIEKTRKDGSVVYQDKSYVQLFSHYTFQDICKATSSSRTTITSYRLSAAYIKKLNSRLSSGLVDDLAKALFGDMGTVVSPSPENNCLMFEMMTSGDITLILHSLPDVAESNTLALDSLHDIDLKTKLKMGTVAFSSKKNTKKLIEILPETSDFEEPLNRIISDTKVTIRETDDTDDPIIKHLINKAELGATFTDLQNVTGLSRKDLHDNLEKLEREYIVKRVGNYENIIILSKFVSVWSIEVNKERFVPVALLDLNNYINLDLFIKRCGLVLNKVFSTPGVSIMDLVNQCEYFSARCLQYICEFLLQIECVKMKVGRMPQFDLFTEDEFIEFEEYTKYESPNSIVVFPVANSLTKFALIRKKILDYMKNSPVYMMKV